MLLYWAWHHIIYLYSSWPMHPLRMDQNISHPLSISCYQVLLWLWFQLVPSTSIVVRLIQAAWSLYSSPTHLSVKCIKMDNSGFSKPMQGHLHPLPQQSLNEGRMRTDEWCLLLAPQMANNQKKLCTYLTSRSSSNRLIQVQMKYGHKTGF